MFEFGLDLGPLHLSLTIRDTPQPDDHDTHLDTYLDRAEPTPDPVEDRIGFS